MNDPTRLLESPDTSELMRGALEAGRDELPTDAQLESLAAKLGPLLFPGGGGPGPGPGAGMGAGAGVAIGVTVLAAAIVGVVLLSPPDDPPEVTEPAAELVPAPDDPPEPVPIPTGVDVPEPVEVDDDTPAAPRRHAAPTYETDLGAELALIRRAQDALRSSPSESMTLVREHQRRFGPGTLAQEREVVAVDALSRLGRDDEARARGLRFHERWPRSAHGRRIDVILGERTR